MPDWIPNRPVPRRLDPGEILRTHIEGGLPRNTSAVLGGLGAVAVDELLATGAGLRTTLDPKQGGARAETMPLSLPETDAINRLERSILSRPRPDVNVGVNLFSRTPDAMLARRQMEFVETLAVGTLIMTSNPDFTGLGDDQIMTLLEIALSEAPEDRLRREILLGGPQVFPGFEEPEIPKLPDHLVVSMQTLELMACFRATAGAVNRLSNSISGVSYMLRKPLPHIDEVDPIDACPGSVVTLRGTNFGPETDGVVLFPSRRFSSNAVRSSSPGVTWSDTEITVTVPPNARPGTVGIYTERVAPDDSGGVGAATVEDLAGCLGSSVMDHAAAVFGQAIHIGPLAPAYQFDGKNAYLGGLPRVLSFECSPSVNLSPHGTVELSWKVEGATRVELSVQQVGNSAHEIPTVPKQLQATGSIKIGPIPGTRRWKAAFVLTARNHCGTDSRTIDVSMSLRVGLALGGGGSRGDFQVGALRYLYDVKGIRPDAIAATSVGAINAVQLVQGDTPAGNAAKRVEDEWRALVDDSSMWNFEPWLLNLSASSRHIIRSMSAEGLLALPYSVVTWIAHGSNISELVNAFGGPNPPNAFYNISPIEARLKAAFSASRAQQSGIQLRLVSVSLETGETIHVTQTGAVLGKNTSGQSSNVVAGAMASAAMPAIFPPVRVGNHMCVDGGVRDVVPVETAVKDLGCHLVYAIRLSAPPLPEPFTPNRGIAAIAARAVLSTTFDELADNDVAPFGGWGPGVTVKVIESTLDIHDPTVVDPGLIDIGINYGWMRASDVLDVATANQQKARQLSDEITQLRVLNWELAHMALRPITVPRQRFGFSFPSFVPQVPSQTQSLPDRAAVTSIRNNCRQIRDKIVARLAINASCRGGYESWFQNWETIPYQPWTNTPWDGYTADPLGDLPAEAPPTI